MQDSNNEFFDGSEYSRKCTAQQDQQKELQLGDEAQRLNPIQAARKALNPTAAEEKLVQQLMVFNMLCMIAGITVRDKDALHNELDRITIKYERELLLGHRAIVAKAVSDSRTPAAGTF